MKKNSKRKVLLAAIAVLCAVLLSGCQLAKESGELGEDRLIGVFLTWEYLDLFEHDAFMDDNIDRIVQGKKISADGGAYQGKLFAVQQENRDFVFEGVEGMNYFVPLCTDEMGNTYHMICADAGISGGDRHIHSSDDGEAITMTGIIYVAPREEDRVLYQNPVYQTPDGQVYAMQGSGMGFAGGVSGFSFKTEESSTLTDERGSKINADFSLEITIEEMKCAERITVLQMGAGHEILKAEEIKPENAPGSIVPEAECAYLLMERMADGEIQRTLIERTEDGMEVFSPRHDGVMVAEYIPILWQE